MFIDKVRSEQTREGLEELIGEVQGRIDTRHDRSARDITAVLDHAFSLQGLSYDDRCDILCVAIDTLISMKCLHLASSKIKKLLATLFGAHTRKQNDSQNAVSNLDKFQQVITSLCAHGVETNYLDNPSDSVAIGNLKIAKRMMKLVACLTADQQRAILFDENKQVMNCIYQLKPSIHTRNEAWYRYYDAVFTTFLKILTRNKVAWEDDIVGLFSSSGTTKLRHLLVPARLKMHQSWQGFIQSDRWYREVVRSTFSYNDADKSYGYDDTKFTQSDLDSAQLQIRKYKNQYRRFFSHLFIDIRDKPLRLSRMRQMGQAVDDYLAKVNMESESAETLTRLIRAYLALIRIPHFDPQILIKRIPKLAEHCLSREDHGSAKFLDLLIASTHSEQPKAYIEAIADLIPRLISDVSDYETVIFPLYFEKVLDLLQASLNAQEGYLRERFFVRSVVPFVKMVKTYAVQVSQLHVRDEINKVYDEFKTWLSTEEGTYLLGLFPPATTGMSQDRDDQSSPVGPQSVAAGEASLEQALMQPFKLETAEDCIRELEAVAGYRNRFAQNRVIEIIACLKELNFEWDERSLYLLARVTTSIATDNCEELMNAVMGVIEENADLLLSHGEEENFLYLAACSATHRATTRSSQAAASSPVGSQGEAAGEYPEGEHEQKQHDGQSSPGAERSSVAGNGLAEAGMSGADEAGTFGAGERKGDHPPDKTEEFSALIDELIRLMDVRFTAQDTNPEQTSEKINTIRNKIEELGMCDISAEIKVLSRERLTRSHKSLVNRSRGYDYGENPNVFRDLWVARDVCQFLYEIDANYELREKDQAIFDRADKCVVNGESQNQYTPFESIFIVDFVSDLPINMTRHFIVSMLAKPEFTEIMLDYCLNYLVRSTFTRMSKPEDFASALKLLIAVSNKACETPKSIEKYKNQIISMWHQCVRIYIPALSNAGAGEDMVEVPELIHPFKAMVNRMSEMFETTDIIGDRDDDFDRHMSAVFDWHVNDPLFRCQSGMLPYILDESKARKLDQEQRPLLDNERKQSKLWVRSQLLYYAGNPDSLADEIRMDDMANYIMKFDMFGSGETVKYFMMTWLSLLNNPRAGISIDRTFGEPIRLYNVSKFLVKKLFLNLWNRRLDKLRVIVFHTLMTAFLWKGKSQKNYLLLSSFLDKLDPKAQTGNLAYIQATIHCLTAQINVAPDDDRLQLILDLKDFIVRNLQRPNIHRSDILEVLSVVVRGFSEEELSHFFTAMVEPNLSGRPVSMQSNSTLDDSDHPMVNLYAMLRSSHDQQDYDASAFKTFVTALAHPEQPSEVNQVFEALPVTVADQYAEFLRMKGLVPEQQVLVRRPSQAAQRTCHSRAGGNLGLPATSGSSQAAASSPVGPQRGAAGNNQQTTASYQPGSLGLGAARMIAAGVGNRKRKGKVGMGRPEYGDGSYNSNQNSIDHTVPIGEWWGSNGYLGRDSEYSPATAAQQPGYNESAAQATEDAAAGIIPMQEIPGGGKEGPGSDDGRDSFGSDDPPAARAATHRATELSEVTGAATSTNNYRTPVGGEHRMFRAARAAGDEEVMVTFGA